MTKTSSERITKPLGPVNYINSASIYVSNVIATFYKTNKSAFALTFVVIGALFYCVGFLLARSTYKWDIQMLSAKVQELQHELDSCKTIAWDSNPCRSEPTEEELEEIQIEAAINSTHNGLSVSDAAKLNTLADDVIAIISTPSSSHESASLNIHFRCDSDEPCGPRYYLAKFDELYSFAEYNHENSWKFVKKEKVAEGITGVVYKYTLQKNNASDDSVLSADFRLVLVIEDGVTKVVSHKKLRGDTYNF
ncbi:MAG: hypothetical protein R3B92_01120 [Patescibacteria group bacterium]